jgi:hypothetical protein
VKNKKSIWRICFKNLLTTFLILSTKSFSPSEKTYFEVDINLANKFRQKLTKMHFPVVAFLSFNLSASGISRRILSKKLSEWNGNKIPRYINKHWDNNFYRKRSQFFMDVYKNVPWTL